MLSGNPRRAKAVGYRGGIFLFRPLPGYRRKKFSLELLMLKNLRASLHAFDEALRDLPENTLLKDIDGSIPQPVICSSVTA